MKIYRLIMMFITILVLLSLNALAAASNLKVAAASSEIASDDSMIIAGDIFPHRSTDQEGKLRANAVIIESNTKVCIISCDVIILGRDILDNVCKKIEAQENIPFENILITCTHTHHAPSTVTVHGYKREEVFCQRLKDAIVSAVHKANEKLKNIKNSECFFTLGHECTVGQNSRMILDDNTILWVPLTKDFAFLRPTGPFDSELPVLAFKQADGKLETILFNHSTHNIGAHDIKRSPGSQRSGIQDIMDAKKRSPGFYGLAAQELEQELGGTSIFLLGAAGSTHDLSLSTDEKIIRIKNAVKETYSKAEKREISRIVSVKKEFEYKVRTFDENKEEKAVSYYCRKRWVGDPESVIEVFRKMRRELTKYQGEIRKGWLQVILIGDVAFVGVPGEFFTKLGMEIKRRSPFRYTYIIELANDYIGYIPDKEAFDLGGYQVWTGFHSLVSPGSGEAIVDEAVGILNRLYIK